MHDSRYYINERFARSAEHLLIIDDIDNQSALSLAQQYDPKGLRTIGTAFDIESS